MSKITKGNRTITDYLQSLKVIADQLASLGKPIDYEDFIERILDGLDSNYKSLKDSINGRDTTISFEELHEKLINCNLPFNKKLMLLQHYVSLLCSTKPLSWPSSTL